MKAGPSLTSGERSLRIRADLKLDTISGEGGVAFCWLV